MGLIVSGTEHVCKLPTSSPQTHRSASLSTLACFVSSRLFSLFLLFFLMLCIQVFRKAKGSGAAQCRATTGRCRDLWLLFATTTPRGSRVRAHHSPPRWFPLLVFQGWKFSWLLPWKLLGLVLLGNYLTFLIFKIRLSTSTVFSYFRQVSSVLGMSSVIFNFVFMFSCPLAPARDQPRAHYWFWNGREVGLS